MDIAALTQRKADIESRHAQLREQATQVDQEIRRLEGEHRLILDLLGSSSSRPLAKPKRIRKVVTDAKTE